MPPPRRRRPVQPATRVRLPRTARRREAGPAEPGQAAWPEDANGHAADLAAAENGHAPSADLAAAGNGHGHPADLATAEAGTTTDEQAEAETTTDEQAEAETTTDEQAEAGTTTDEETAGLTAGEQGIESDATGRVQAEAGTTDWDDLDRDEPDDEGAAGNEPAAGADRGEAATRADRGEAGEGASVGREPMLLPVCLQVVAVMLGGLAVWFALKSGGSASPPASFGGFTGTNTAVIDNSATNQVNRQIDSAVDTVFSYNYADTAKTATAAKNLLTGRASQEYAALFKEVEQQAPADKLVLTTTVTNSGVEMLSGDTARLLIFANQQDTATSSHSTTNAGAMFSVTAVHQDGRWKIEDIDTFSAGG